MGVSLQAVRTWYRSLVKIYLTRGMSYLESEDHLEGVKNRVTSFEGCFTARQNIGSNRVSYFGQESVPNMDDNNTDVA